MSTTVTQEVRGLVPAGTWSVDPAHSNIQFGIKHLLTTTVTGRFADFEGTIEVTEDGETRAAAVIRAASIDTNQPQRDEHLRSPDFFDAGGFPEIRFESKRVEGLDDGRFRVVGDLEIRGTTREVELEAIFGGVNRDPYGNERVGLELRGELDPNEWGVDWNQELETGGNLIGDRAHFVANVSAVRAG